MERYGNIKEIHRNIILTFIIAVSSLFIGLLMIFFLIMAMPGDIAMGSYFIDFFSGDWGTIKVGITDVKLTKFLRSRFGQMIDVCVLPVLIGLALGILLGRVSSRNKGKRKDKIIQICSIFGISIPVFWMGMVLQYFLCFKLDLFPCIGYKTRGIGDPRFRTGSRFIDCLLAGEMDILGNYIYHLILPGFILTIATIALVTWQARSYMANKFHDKSIISNTTVTGMTFGFIITSYLLIDSTFNLYGVNLSLMQSLSYWYIDLILLRGILFTFLIFFVIITFISNLLFTLYRFLKSKYLEKKVGSRMEIDMSKGNDAAENNPEESIKEYFLNKLKSPLGIIGAILFFFLICISILPQVITGYSLEEVLVTHPGSDFQPPSPEHPLGTTKWGWDVLALMMWGITDSVIFGFMAVLIGLIGGAILGYIAGKFNRRVYKALMGFMIIFYIIPGFILVLLFNRIGGFQTEVYRIDYWVSLLVLGILLIPSFARIIANAMSPDISMKRIGKAVIIHVPLYAAFAIVIYVSIGFFSRFHYINLGRAISYTRDMVMIRPGALFWFGYAILFTVMSLLLFHVVLQDYGPELRRRESIESSRS